MPVNGKSNGRFELPALAPINFNLTDGTNIPPPLPDSPIEEKAPTPPSKAIAPPIATNGEIKEAASNGGYEGRGRTDTLDRPPLSPISTTRPSSIRRFLSRKSLNANYTNGTNTNKSNEDLSGIGRPDSPSSFLDGRPKPKKSASWFRRLGSNNRTSVIYENRPEEKKVPKGPPPPKLPELNQLKAKVADDGGSFAGEDLFKNIK